MKGLFSLEKKRLRRELQQSCKLCSMISVAKRHINGILGPTVAELLLRYQGGLSNSKDH